MFRFIACERDRVLEELGQNKATMEKEHENYAQMAKSFKEKQEHYTKQLNDLSTKK